MGYSQDIKTGKIVVKEFEALTGTQTEALDLEGGTLVAIIRPASMAGTSLTIQNAPYLEGTYATVCNKENTDFSITTDTNSRQTYIEPTISAGLRCIKLTSGSSETAKTFTALIRNID